MKLLLASEALLGNIASEFTKLVDKKSQDIHIALVENAADTYAEEKKAWVYDNRATLTNAGYQVELIDLRDYKGKTEELRAKLADKDAIWLNGGNTFYLRWILRESGGDVVIPELVKNGLVYGGGSAGSLVAGPTIKHIETADDPEDAPELIWEGMSIVDTVVMPHMDNEKYGSILKKSADLLKAEGFKVICINDNQAVVFNDDQQTVVSTEQD